MSQPTQWDIDELRQTFKLVDGVLYKKTNKKEEYLPANILQTNEQYGYVTYKSTYLRVHRLVWMLHYGYNPTILDHINGDKMNNSIENLREVTNRENQQNQCRHRKGKLPGIRKSADAWHAHFKRNQVAIEIGPYHTKEDAHQVYIDAIQHLDIQIDNNIKWRDYLIEQNRIKHPLINEDRNIRQDPLSHKWILCTHIPKMTYLGSYNTKEEAIQGRITAEEMQANSFSHEDFMWHWKKHYKEQRKLYAIKNPPVRKKPAAKQITYLTAWNETKTLHQWSKDTRCLVTYAGLSNRHRLGWNAEEALTLPIYTRCTKKLTAC